MDFNIYLDSKAPINLLHKEGKRKLWTIGVQG